MRMTLLSEDELRKIISEAVHNAIALLPRPRSTGQPMTRQAAALYLGVSLSTMDRISRNYPDLVPRHRDARGRPYYLSTDLDKYLGYVGKRKIE